MFSYKGGTAFAPVSDEPLVSSTFVSGSNSNIHKSSMVHLVVTLGKQSNGSQSAACSVRTRRGASSKPRSVVVTSQSKVGGQALRADSPTRADSRRSHDNLNWVLLLDDEPINTRGLSRWLKHTMGLETRSARTIQQAERWLACMPAPCAIVSDFDLEGPDTAVTALGRFRALGVQSKALVLTGAPIRARAALADAGWVQTPVLSKANFQAGLKQWLLEEEAAKSRSA
jgi:hypothetical protein